MVTCPACDAVLDVEEEELDEGDELTCEECGQTLTVSSTDPLELKAGEASGDDDEEEEEEDFDELDEDEEEEEEEEEDEDW
jgi:DNA-directed RNA polymerase subunit M/transcription elongation factor TFIIS